jgi:hypothetical protein
LKVQEIIGPSEPFPNQPVLPIKLLREASPPHVAVISIQEVPHYDLKEEEVPPVVSKICEIKSVHFEDLKELEEHEIEQMTPISLEAIEEPMTPITPGAIGEPMTPIVPGSIEEPTTPITPGAIGEPTTTIIPGEETPLGQIREENNEEDVSDKRAKE